VGSPSPTPLFFSKIPDNSDLDSPVAGDCRLTKEEHVYESNICPARKDLAMSNPDHLEPKELVRESYNHISHAYRSDSVSRDKGYFRWLEILTPLLQQNDPVLDLGCGCGIPVAQELARTFHVTGVDISEVQITRAKTLVPDGTFLCEDITSVNFPAHSFAAIVSFFAIIHIPLQEQRPIFENIFRWLKPGGYFMVTVGRKAWTGYDEDWYGARMYWSFADEETYLNWLQDIGFVIQQRQFLPEGDSGFVLLLAKKPNDIDTHLESE